MPQKLLSGRLLVRHLFLKFGFHNPWKSRFFSVDDALGGDSNVFRK